MLFSSSVAQLLRNKKKFTERLIAESLSTCLLLSYISILATNFFGFSTTNIQLFFYLIPGMIVVINSKNTKRNTASPSPDEWYRGAVSLADEIVEIDPKTGQAKSIAAGANIDVLSPFVAPDGSFLFFQDKKTGALWRLTL